MARADKQAAVAEIVDSFNDAAGAVLTEYRGLTVKQLQELRRSLGANANYAVVKNTLAKIAAKDAGIDGFDDLLTGPTAIAFIKGDVVEAAKGLRDFAKANPTLVIKGGVLDGKPLGAKEVAQLA
ncbi:MAG TPA: 50S ribosomal protein L10, partial [Nocardioides sp.]|nr:50S ribosomal protein L10 [Nocardioides sp.]